MKERLDNLFKNLSNAACPASRNALVCEAMLDGISEDEIRDMLDYLEHRESERTATVPQPPAFTRRSYSLRQLYALISSRAHR